MIYGIVIIKIYSCNKELYTFKVAWFSLLYCLRVQRLEKPKMSVVYCGAPIYLYICDTLSLDNPKTHSHLALPYITPLYMWGDHMMPIPYNVRGDHQIPIPYKVQRDHKRH